MLDRIFNDTLIHATDRTKEGSIPPVVDLGTHVNDIHKEKVN